MIKRILMVFIARNREFYRDSGGLAWNMIFPVLLILGFAFAFSSGEQERYKIGVFPASEVDKNDTHSFLDLQYTRFVPMDDSTEAIEKVRRHQIDMLLIPGKKENRYWINPESAKGYFLEKIVGTQFQTKWVKQEVSGTPIRYVDWLVPGILAMNMMFSALFGVGWIIVRYRKTGYLKRLKATPLRAWEFIIGQVISRLVVIVGSSIVVFAGTFFIVRFPMNGSYLLLLAVFSAGSFCMISLGLIFASRFKNEELVSGLLNFLTWPMMFLSGVWFSLDGIHPWLKTFSRLLPLTHLIDASRAIMIDGADFNTLKGTFLLLILLSIAFIMIGSALFKWE